MHRLDAFRASPATPAIRARPSRRGRFGVLAAAAALLVAAWGSGADARTASVAALPATTLAASTTDVSVLANPAIIDSTGLLSATISALPPATATPTGSVTFFDNGSEVGIALLNPGGVGNLTLPWVVLGDHTITATYSGDANLLPSSGALASNPLVVVKATASQQVTSNANPLLPTLAASFVDTLTNTTGTADMPSGTVAFFVDGAAVGTATVNGSGVATLTGVAVAPGSHSVTASYSGDAHFNAGSAALSGNPLVVAKATLPVQVSSSMNPALLTQALLFTATFNDPVAGDPVPTGMITFLSDGVVIGTATLVGGSAALANPALALGKHTITAQYSGDDNFNASSGVLNTNPQVIANAFSLTDGTSSADPSVVGQAVTFSVSVSPVSPATQTPTGTITFTADGVVLGTQTLVTGVAALTTTALAQGTHTVEAIYEGDANFAGSGVAMLQTVVPAATMLSILPPPPAQVGVPLVITLDLGVASPGGGMPTGVITVNDSAGDAGDECIATLPALTCTLTPSTAGTLSLNAIYLGDANYMLSVASGTLVVSVASVDLALHATPNPAAPGQLVTLTAMLSQNPAPAAAVTPHRVADTTRATRTVASDAHSRAAAGVVGAPTGSVIFSEGGTMLAPAVTLSGGVASYSTASLPVGAHTITATYVGDANDGPASATINLTIAAAAPAAVLPAPLLSGRLCALLAALMLATGLAMRRRGARKRGV